MPFDVDFQGRLQKIRAPISASLHAVFEAVANSFDATKHLAEKGRIVVRIIREVAPDLFTRTDGPQYVLTGFEIEDNGIGFTDGELTHFKRADTRNKEGGKGVGRFLWLKVFDRAEISSTYEQGGKAWKREFTFSVEKNGVQDADTAPKAVDRNGHVTTRVRLMAPKKERIAVLSMSAKDLAVHLLEHFLLHFTVIRSRSLTVEDVVAHETIAVEDVYAEVVANRHKEEAFDIRGYSFKLHHLLVKPGAVLVQRKQEECLRERSER